VVSFDDHSIVHQRFTLAATPLRPGTLNGCRWNLTSGAEAACSVHGNRFDRLNAAPSDQGTRVGF
jgi:hypothetical protein